MVEPAGDIASLVSVVLEVGKWFARPIGRRFMYLYNHRNNLDNLENEVQKLKDAKEEVKNKVVAAENNVEKIKQSVRQWQDEVNSIIHEAEPLIAEKANDRCFKGFCPDLITRYKDGKKAFVIKEDNISPLLQQLKDFDEVSYPTALEDLWLKPDKNYDLFISRDSTFRIVLKALNDANVNVGVYGMGGIGKTTLVKEIGRQAKKEKIFEVVVYVEVNKTLDIERIQKEIARNLGVKFEEETQRAIDGRGCKLLLTARERQPLQKMGCPNPLQIDSLNGKESWRLFKTTAGDFIETQECKSLAENICNRCGGLPIAIVTVAKALKTKRHSSQWKEALRQFKRSSPKNFTRDIKEAYATMELSYKYLKGLDIFHGIYTIEEARDKVNALIYDLKDSCLLLSGHTYESFSMHDFVREVALSIANRDDHLFSVRNEIKWEWSHRDRLKICKKIFVRDSTIGDLSKGFLDCPQLESFFINKKVGDSHVKIPDNFFIGMKKLKVLDLDGMQFSFLQSSLGLLVNLQTLCLDYSEFEHVAIIGELKELKILSLRGSSVEQLPKEIGQLTQLKLLDLSDCDQLEVIAPNVLSNLVQLEELYMNGCLVLWEVDGFNIQRNDASLEELKHLQLTTLEIDIKDDEIVPECLFTKKLDRYRISIGAGWSKFGHSFISSDLKQMGIKSFSYDKPITSIRKLKLKLNSTIWSDNLQGFKNVECLCLDQLEGINNVVFDLDKEGFSQLKHLCVHNNPNVLCIVDSIKCTPHDAFLALESLILFNLINLEKICCGQPTIDSFSNLKIIEVAHCVKLKNIFSSSNCRSLPHLQTIHVANCKNMKGIFIAEREDNVNNNEIIKRVKFYQLRTKGRRVPRSWHDT
ncbi:probable disease resistance protein At4g27220 [Pistacia vera]|uniref:probable disease resistance protein At4g27220 n=1 Tax=Pistacia vera TaxID=55513 RepID=UPI001262DCB9|nr:probable disease resistance protein At4g27220 [Pistacia vera]